MKLHKSIVAIFDKSNNTLINNEWIINEHENGAIFKTVKIRDIQAGSYSIDSDLYRNRFEKVFENSTILNDKDCDGCAIIHHNQNKYILLVELKSGFDPTRISKAYEQALTTLLKNHMLFSLCDGYDIKEYDICIMIVCLPPNEAKKVWLKDQYLLMQNSGVHAQQDCCFAARLYMEQKIDTKLRDVTLFTNCPFNTSINDLNIHITLKNPPTTSDTELDLSINTIL